MLITLLVVLSTGCEAQLNMDASVDSAIASTGATFNNAVCFVTNPSDHKAVAAFSTDLQPAVEQRVEFYASYPVGATTKPTGYVEWFPFAAPLAPRVCVKHTSGETTGNVTFTQDVILPISFRIDTAPTIASNFTKFRAVGGRLTVSSKTTSTTSAALSGVLHGGSLWDTRQSDAYDPTDLAARSGVASDGCLGVPIDEGITAIIGPDINPDFSPALTGQDLDLTEGSALTTEVFWTGSGTRWFSWCGNSTVGGVVRHVIEEPSRIAPTGYKVAWNRASGTTVGALAITHVYAQGNATIGGVATTLNRTEELWLPASAGTGAPQNVVIFAPEIDGYLYLGSYFAATSAELNVWVTPITTRVGKTGYVGPARVLCFEQVGAGQNIAIEGQVVVEVVAGPTLAPFADAMTPVIRMPADFLVGLQALYRTPNAIFRRVYSNSSYQEALTRLSQGEAANIAGQLPQFQVAGRASGFLPGLSSFDGAFRDAESALGYIDRGTAALQTFQGIKNRFIPGRAAGFLKGAANNTVALKRAQVAPFSALFSPYTARPRGILGI